MQAITDLDLLLKSMKPELLEEEFVFCTVKGELIEYCHLCPQASFIESEGLTLVLTKTNAESEGLHFDSVFKQITLTVHSSLDAVGLTAAFSQRLSEQGISANVIAGYYHDHIFVPRKKAQEALEALMTF